MAVSSHVLLCIECKSCSQCLLLAKLTRTWMLFEHTPSGKYNNPLHLFVLVRCLMYSLYSFICKLLFTSLLTSLLEYSIIRAAILDWNNESYSSLLASLMIPKLYTK